MTMNDLPAAGRFLETALGNGPGRVLCAVSGGLDSMCLLHFMTQWGRERNISITAAHFNHRLRGAESDRDEAFVREWCAARDIPAVFGEGDVRAHAAETGKTAEEAARDLRYEFLLRQKAALGCDALLTAHHADDNAETMLLNLLRGTGTRGLAGIPAHRDGILRPFLHVTREELAAYAANYYIKYVEDSTNAADEAARNVLRHRVLPVLRELNPAAVENMARAAEQLRREDEALGRVAEDFLKRNGRFSGETARLAAAPCLGAERAVADRVLYAFLARMAGSRKDLTARHVEALWGLLCGPAGKELSLPCGLTARREEQDLLLTQTPTIPEERPIRVGETVFFGNWAVTLAESGPGTEMVLPTEAELSVTAWKREDRMALPDSRGGRSLKRLCAEGGISPAERDGLPVLRVDGKCAAVPGIGIHREFLTGTGRPVFLTFKTEEKDYDEK